MRLRFGLNPAEPPAAATTQAGKFSADQRGTTAIEFAMVIGPFLFLLFGIISVGLYFFVIFTLEHAVESAARVIRTGQAQTQTPNVMTPGEFKARVCAKLPPFMDCTSVTNKIRVNGSSCTRPSWHPTAPVVDRHSPIRCAWCCTLRPTGSC